jgi:hypothetical protein
MNENQRLWAAIELLMQISSSLWDRSLAQAKEKDQLVPLRGCLEKFAALSKLILQPRATGHAQLYELVRDMAVTLDEYETDKRRPVEVTLIRSNGENNHEEKTN